jgi:hypothetical protein
MHVFTSLTVSAVFLVVLFADLVTCNDNDCVMCILRNDVDVMHQKHVHLSRHSNMS